MRHGTDENPDENRERVPGGRYRIKQELGHGGTSVVWLASDSHLQKDCAIKEIRKTTGQANSLSAEIRMLRSLHHPSLPGIIDVLDAADRVFIVMEYIEGESLDILLRKTGPVSETVAADWLKQLADVLLYLHSQEPPVIYSDMKPSNIIRRTDGRLVLVDLGTAREYKAARSKDTVMMGTWGYAAPEQHGGGRTDRRSDIYSLGITITELLTGVSPYKDPYFYQKRSLSAAAPFLSDGMSKILKRCTALSPQDRYPDCGALLKDLRQSGGRRHPARRINRRLPVPVLFLLIGTAAAFLSGTGQLQAKETPDTKQTALLSLKERLCFTAGQTYLYKNPGRQKTLRERILRAYPLFLTADEAAEEMAVLQGRDTAEHVQIRNYKALCRFYTEYVFDDAGIREPGEEEYEKLLTGIQECLHAESIRDTEDDTYLRMLLWQSILGLLREFRQGFASAGIPLKELLDITNTISEYTAAESVQRDSLEKLRAQIQNDAAETEDSLCRTYENLKRWKKTKSED